MKVYEPGQDRFKGLDVTEGNGGVILNGALAYLECTVQSRMEVGDHWLVYATVDNGKVLNQDGITAIHHRKSASFLLSVSRSCNQHRGINGTRNR